MWLQDFEIGQTFESPPLRVDADMIREFAARYDPQPFHLDSEAAERSVFGGLVASGWHTAALTMQLFVPYGPQIEGGTIGLSAEELRWSAVRPGDELRLHVEVVEVKPSTSRPDRGIVRLRSRTLNQRDEEAQHMVVSVLVPARTDG